MRQNFPSVSLFLTTDTEEDPKQKLDWNCDVAQVEYFFKHPNNALLQAEAVKLVIEVTYY